MNTSLKKKKEQLKKTTHLCYVCREKLFHEKEGSLATTLEHKTPSSKNGGNNYRNLTLAHAVCNHIRGNRDICAVRKLPQIMFIAHEIRNGRIPKKRHINYWKRQSCFDCVNWHPLKTFKNGRTFSEMIARDLNHLVFLLRSKKKRIAAKA